MSNILFVEDIPKNARLITNSQDIKSILEDLKFNTKKLNNVFMELEEIDILCGSIFVLENNDVYGFQGEIPYLYKRVYYIGNMESV